MKPKGFSLLELLIALAILSLLLGTVLGFTQTSARLERGHKALSLLAEDLSLTATVLAREVYLAGYRVNGGTPLEVQTGQENDTLTLRFFCESGMEAFCSTQTMNATRRIGYRVGNSTLYWGVCRDSDCSNFRINNPVMDGIEAFRIAYRSGGSWIRQNLSATASPTGVTPKVEMVAIYLLARSTLRTGARGFSPGSTVDWYVAPDGTGLKGVLALPTGRPGDGYPRAERLVVVQTPNLAR